MSLNENNLHHIISLFKALQNLSISKEGYDELKQWASLSEENKAIWDSFNDETLIEDHRNQFESFNSELALKKINYRVKMRQILRYAAVAALLLLMFSFSFYFIRTTKPLPPEVEELVVNDILPGGNKAILKFSDRETITLDSNQNGIQIAENGISYTNGGLVKQNTNATALRTVTLSVPRGGKYEITLDDGTRIWINADTELKFPESFKNAKTREVELKGEAYFEVAHNASKPFKVKMADETIEVLGTSFNLSNYPSDLLNKTTLFTGKIALSLNTQPQAKTVMVPGEQAIYNKQDKKLAIVNVDGRKELAWKNGDFLYEKDHILTIMKQVERWYDIKVIYEGNFSKSYFSGIVSRSQPLSAVLEMLATTDKLKFRIDKERKEVVLTTN